MCGIAGLIDLDGRPIEPELLKAMTDAIRHRGPDDDGYVLIDQRTARVKAYAGMDSPDAVRAALRVFRPADVEFSGNIGLSHRRFSIIDLTIRGHQPMFNERMNISLVYNGEIYNYVELRAELESRGVSFRTSSDTEVLLKAYRDLGYRLLRTPQRLLGPRAV